MRVLRILLAIVAIAALVTAMNAVVWAATPALFFWLLLAAGVGGLGWLVLTVSATGGPAVLQGRAVGGLKAVVDSLLFLSICILIYLFVRYPGASWDLSQEGRRELAPQTVQVLENMAEEVEVLCFFVDVDNDLVRIAREKTLRFLDRCQRHTDLLQVEVADPQVDRVSLQEMGVTHLSPKGTVVVKSGGQQSVIWFSGGSPRLEEGDFTNALIKVLRDKEPSVYFLTGHEERRIDDEHETEGASLLNQFLVGESYTVKPLAIQLSDPEIPDDCTVLVIQGPKSDLYPEEIAAIDDYIAEGGRVFVLIEPWMLMRQGNSAARLRGWLEDRFGIVVPKDLVVAMPGEQGLLDRDQNPVQVQLNADPAPFADIEEPPDAWRGCYSLKHPVTNSFDQSMLLQAAGTVTKTDAAPEGVVVQPVLRTPPDFWAETDLGTQPGSNRFVPEPGPDEARGPLTLAVGATWKTDTPLGDTGRVREARALVVGNERFASNAEIATGPGGNLNFMLNAMAWLSQREDLIAVRPSPPASEPLVLSADAQRTVTWVTILFTVQVVLFAGALVYLVRRRNR
ncbi:MAG: GldG family protein [Candidatus Hydrogenedentota bacterium]